MRRIKNIFALLLGTLIMMPLVASADNLLTLETFDIKAGETKDLIIDMENDQAITALQFDLLLPNGLSIAEENDELQFDIEGRTTWKKHSLDASVISNGYRFVMSSNSNATISGNSGALISVTLTAASTFKTGTITIQNIELATPNALKIHPDPISLDITLPKVTVTINDAVRSYGAENPQFTYTASTNDDLTGLVTLSCEATKTSNIGEYAITGTSTATDLEVTFEDGKLTVNPAALTVTANAKSKVYGADDPALTYVATGLVNGDVLTGSLTRAEGDAVGTYAITQGTLAASSNYTLSFNGANFTITAKAVTSPTIELSQSSFDYDGTAKEPTVIVKDGATVIPSSEYTVSYANNTSVGTATVTITDKEGGNYTVSGTRTFTITAKSVAAPTIELATSTFVYDGTAQEPGVTVKDGTTTIPASEYTISYSNNTNAGTATVTITDKDGGDYTVSGSTNFVITKAPLTVKAKDAQRYIGEENPTFELEYTGFKNSETESVLTTKPTATTTATAASAAGTYEIAVSGGEAQNYTFSYVPGTLTVNAKAQITITAKNVSRTYGEANPQLEYTVNGGEITGTPELTCEAVPGSPVGEYTIVVSQGTIPTAASYDLIFVNGKLTVTKAMLTVTADNKERVYGAANPALTIQYSGFKIGDNASKLTAQPVATTTATVTSKADTYDIIVSGGADTNYDFSYNKGTLTVSKAALTATADAKTRKYGQGNPDFTITYSGFVNDDSEQSLKVRPLVTVNADATSAVGTYPITLTGGEAQNYTLTLQNGTLTVTKATLKATAQNASSVYGDDIPTFTVNYEGFVNGEDKSVLTSEATATTEATKTSNAGTYPIAVSGGEATNYQFSEYVSGTLTITQAPLTVKAKDAQRYVGDENPTFELEYTGFKNADTESVLTTQPTATTEATKDSPKGAYLIVVSGGEAANYTLSYQNGTLTVAEKGTITITATNVSRAYGDANPTLEYTVIGDNITGTPSLTCEAVPGSPVGEYVITVTKGTIINDANFDFHNGTLTVTPAPLMVTTSATRTYGAENPAFTLSYEGFKNGEDENVLTTKPTAATEATATSAVGTYPVTVSGGEAQNYAITYSEGTLTVTKAPLTVTATDVTRSYGQDNPTFAVTYSGFLNDETVAVLKREPAATTTATKMSDVGTYAITVTGGESDNYELTAVSGTLTVTKAPLKAKVQDAECEYGTLPTFTIAYEGFINGDNESEFTTAPVAQTEATATSPVGVYDVTLSGGEAKNYDFTEYVSGKLTVTKAPLTVTAKNAGRKVGEANPTFELEYSGFKNGESESVLTTKPVATTTATADSPAGEYDITVSGGEAQNYDITYVPGKLTVSEKTLITITAKNVIRLYGEANPTFEYTVVGGAIEGTPSLTCEATVASNVGEYVIKVSKGSITTDANFVFVDGKLFVDRAPLTVTAKDASREEGLENPAFELEYSGWKNGETESVLTTKPVATTTATANSVAGDYAITVSGGAAQNYEFTYVSGTLTITAKIDDGVVTIFAEDVQGPVYTLGGQRVEHPRKGRLYIVNGQKTILK